jgi:hypothetical protein
MLTPIGNGFISKNDRCNKITVAQPNFICLKFKAEYRFESLISLPTKLKYITQ